MGPLFFTIPKIFNENITCRFQFLFMQRICALSATSVRVTTSFTQTLQYIHNSACLPKGAFPFYNKHKKVTDPARQDPDYFEKEAEKLSLDAHYLDNLKFLWEEKVGSQRELQLKAADLLVGNTTDYGLPEIDRNGPRLEYQKVNALKDAPESVKKIFSIDVGERSDLIAAWKSELLKKVNLHEFDRQSLQAKISWATACIRHYTALVDSLIAQHRHHKRPTWLLHRINLLVHWRTKQLRFLRDKDSAEFERILKELKIAYHLPKEPEHVHTRKAWSEHQLRRRCSAEKEKRLHALQDKFTNDREVRVTAINAELNQLNDEEKEIKEKIASIFELEGQINCNCVGKYEPKLVEEFSEIMLHSILFYHPPLDSNVVNA